MSKIRFRSPEKLAKWVVRQLNLASQGTERNYEQALTTVAKYLKDNRLGFLDTLSLKTAIQYLEHRAEEVSQKTLDLDRQAIQALIKQKLPIIKSEHPTILSTRAYTTEQIKLIANAQTLKNQLATLIAHNAGLRAHELLTLRPAAERPRDTHRPYRSDRFAGRQNVILYTVQGKGGLCREVALDQELARQLETHRKTTLTTTYDRNIGYQAHYHLSGGQRWSNSFSAASERELGWSNGAHGLRHNYAQERMETLQSLGYLYADALELVSQEMGHFRPEITLVYLR